MAVVASTDLPQTQPAEKTLREFLRDFADARRDQDKLRQRYRTCDDIWNAILKPPSDTWESNLHPPYALQKAEAFLSNLVVDIPTQRVRARINGEKQDQAARYLEALLSWQRSHSHFPEKWHTFCQQGTIRPLTVAKVPWVYETRTVRQRITGQGPLGVADHDSWTPIVTANQPDFVPVDVNHFWWDPAATNIDSAEWVVWRDYSCLDDLKAQADAGLFDPALVDQITGDKGLPPDATDDDKRSLKGRIEICEQWFRDRLVVVANRKVVLRDERNPFGHGMLPFVAASAIPVPFSFVGKSLLELIADHQAALWGLMNQAMDNTRFMANAVTFVDPGIEDDFDQVFPGAKVRARTDQVQMWQPNISILGPAYQAIQALKSEADDLSGINVYTAGTQSSGGPDTNTATGIQLLQNMGQQRLIMSKQQFMNALARAGDMQVKLNQTLLPVPIAVRATGADDGTWLTVSASDIQLACDYEIEDVAESLNRQQRRTDAMTKAQVIAGLAPLAMQSGTHIAWDEIIRDLTEAFGERPDKYLAPAPPMPPMIAPPVSPPSTGGAAPPGPSPAGPPPSGPVPPPGGTAPGGPNG